MGTYKVSANSLDNFVDWGTPFAVDPIKYEDYAANVSPYWHITEMHDGEQGLPFNSINVTMSESGNAVVEDEQWVPYPSARVLEPSEQLHGRIALDILEGGGLFVVTTVTDEATAEIVGWIILQWLGDD